MNDSFTFTNVLEPLFTLEDILSAVERVLPTILYRTTKYAPLTFPTGEPVIIGLPEYGRAKDILEKPQDTGEYIAVLHPDNLPRLREACKGRYRLVEWQPK